MKNSLLDRHPNIIALVAGAISATGFAPLSFWPLTLFACAILIALTERASDRRGAFAVGWMFGLGYFAVGLNWIAHAFSFQDAMPRWFGYGAVILLSLYLAVYPGLASMALHIARTRWPRLPMTPMFAGLWLVSEYARATAFTGFAWNPLGAVWLDTGAEHSATLIGTYGLGALVIITSGGLLAVARRQWHIAGPVLGSMAALAIVGHIEIAPPTDRSGPAITVVQPNIGQAEKYVPAQEYINFAKLTQLTGASSRNARLIFWPEDAVPAWLDMEPEWLSRVAMLAGPNDLLMTGGAKVYFREHNKGFYTDRTLIGANNSAWVVSPTARLLGRYDKAHLVPYGEYLPMRALLEPIGLSRLVPGDTDFWPGPGPRSLPLPAANGRPALKMGVQICYEIIFSGQVVDRFNRPDFLFNPSNDAWFGTWGPPQHLAQARLRAIEEAMPIIRSTPTGISAVIGANGRITASIPHHHAGAINTTLPPVGAPTPFARFGNFLPLFFALLLAGFAVASARMKR